MSKNDTIGIVGGYGAIGVIVAEDLLKNTQYKVLIGGRSQEKTTELVNRLGSRASGKTVDLFDENSLDQFCGECFLIINCSAPSWEIKDIVLKSSLKSGSSFVDPGIYYDKTGNYDEAFRQKGLSAVLYAGWVPGVTGILPRYLYGLYEKKIKKINSLHTFCGDRSGWSPNASVDIMHHFIKGVDSGFFENGKWNSRSFIHDLLDAKFYKYPDPLGRYVVSPVFSIEHQKLAEEIKAQKLGFFAGIFGFRTLLKLLLIRYIDMEDEKAVEILRGALKAEADKKGEGGAIVAEMSCESTTGNIKVKASIYEKNSVWLTGICTSIAARFLISGDINKSGVHFLCDCVEPELFFEQLKLYGVQVQLSEDN